jgi:hypothetical protein
VHSFVRHQAYPCGAAKCLSEYLSIANRSCSRRQLAGYIAASIVLREIASIVLREIEGLSVAETAEARQIPEATVKTRLLRSRRRQQRALMPRSASLRETFPFAGRDCDLLTERVLAKFLCWANCNRWDRRANHQSKLEVPFDDIGSPQTSEACWTPIHVL